MAGKIKPIAFAVALAAFLGLIPSAFAQTVVFNAAGSTAAYNAFALAGIWGSGSAPPGPCGSNIWTQKNGATAHDNRNPFTSPANSIPDSTGTVWVEWDNSTSPTVVCAYIAVDSAVGQRVFMANPRGQLNLPTGFTCSAPPAGQNKVPGLTDSVMTTAVCNAIFGANGASSTCLTGTKCVFNAAPTDIRPEDALWATERTYDTLPSPYSCGPHDTLGYSPGPAPNVGVNIDSAFDTTFVTPALFALSGSDPITGNQVQSWVTSDIGAQSLLVLVNISDTSSNGLGSTQLKNILTWQVGDVFDGTASTTEFIVPGASLTSVTPLHALQREPLSGTYNTFEYDAVAAAPANASQECGVTNPTGGSPDNPLDLTNSSTGGTRQRVIGNGQMISELETVEDGIGYGFFSFGNVAPLVGLGKYLTVNAEDPLYTNGGNPNGVGALPTCTTPPCKLSFPNIANGTYPLWNVLRVTTAFPQPSGITTLLSDAELQAKNEVSDFLPVPLTVLRSHFTDPLQTNTPANGLLCAGETQVGGDMGGLVLTVTNDDNFIKETGGFGVSNGQGGCNAGRSGKIGEELINLQNWATH